MHAYTVIRVCRLFCFSRELQAVVWISGWTYTLLTIGQMKIYVKDLCKVNNTMYIYNSALIVMVSILWQSLVQELWKTFPRCTVSSPLELLINPGPTCETHVVSGCENIMSFSSFTLLILQYVLWIVHICMAVNVVSQNIFMSSTEKFGLAKVILNHLENIIV